MLPSVLQQALRSATNAEAGDLHRVRLRMEIAGIKRDMRDKVLQIAEYSARITLKSVNFSRDPNAQTLETTIDYVRALETFTREITRMKATLDRAEAELASVP